jgi:hypothetical protein
MNDLRPSFPACIIATKSRLTADDVHFIRNISFPNGLMTSDDALVLTTLQNSRLDKCPEWEAYFIEALTDFIVHYTYPQGALDAINAAWLVELVSTDGAIASPLELKLVLNILEVAAGVPAEFRAFALDQLRIAIEDAAGGYSLTRPIALAGITRYDLDYIDRILRSAGATGKKALSSIEIAVLKRIDTLASAHFNHPGWLALMEVFVTREDAVRKASRWLRVPDEMFRAEDAA